MTCKYLIVSIVTLISMTVYGQDGGQCDVSALKKMEDNIGKLKQAEIHDFLMTIGKCQENGAYKKKSNQLLFEVLDKQTQTTVNAMEQEENKPDMEAIAIAISNPLVFTEIDTLIDKVKKTKCSPELKVILLDQLMLAKTNVKKD